MRPIAGTESWTSSQTQDQVWAALTDVSSYPSWWPWLVHFEGRPPAVGEVFALTIRAPARYRVRITVRFVAVDVPTRLAVAVDGDLAGSADIDLRATSAGSAFRFRWDLRPQGRFLRVFGAVMAPVLVHGHGRIMRRGLEQFVEGSGVDLTPVPALDCDP